MLDVNKKAHTGYQSSIAQWAYQAIGLKGVRLRTRLRGDELHILCESTQCPEVETVVPRFLHALNKSGMTTVFPPHPEHPIYQIFLYGRALDRQRPDWVEAVHLNQLDQQTSQWQRQSKSEGKQRSRGTGELGDALTPRPTTPKTALSQESEARSGQPEAIARYLSEALNALGVSVKVVIQDATASLSEQALTLQSQDEVRKEAPPLEGENQSTSPAAQTSPKRRLWVICNADYSPDPSLVAQAVNQRLRELKLEGFHDARILALVSGETLPDWVLRVDMTPPEEMLKDWARWGDVQAIARLLEQALAKEKVEIRAVLKQATLHLFTTNISDVKGSRSYFQEGQVSSKAPDKQAVINAIAPVLESINPQGIQAAVIYGMAAATRSTELGVLSDQSNTASPSQKEESPLWSEWLNLSACSCPALAEPTLALAQQGDEPALIFLLQRLLNSDLDWRLATGGIRVSLRRKQDLLHIMTEAPVCPLQGQVASPIVKFIRQIEIPKIAGVRVYGRRAGQSSPLWSYGFDFTPRTQKAKASPVEFAASADYAPLQLMSLASPEQSLSNISTLSQTLQSLARKLASSLCATQLFIPTAQEKEGHWSFALGQSSSALDKKQRRVALVWGCLGLLLTFQSDWLVGQMLRPLAQNTQSSVVASGQQTIARHGVKPIPQMSLQQKGTSRTKVGGDKSVTFNSSGFTRHGENGTVGFEIDHTNNSHIGRVSAGGAAILAAARSQLPSFNNRLLDEKLALYQQRLLQRGGVPPEVLIVGSSRAMRGIDPTTLRSSLAVAGFEHIEVFNFGINGATAQVVDLMLRRILSSSQLPKLIIWADGARAFNSGRVDATFKAIAASAGYQQLNAGTFPLQRPHTPPSQSASAAASQDSPVPPESGNSLFDPSLTSGYQALETQLNQILAKVSATYPQRSQLVSLMTGYFAQIIPMSAEDEGIAFGSNAREEDGEANLIHLNSDIDYDGFLPLSIRFVPDIYYKHHARVSGDYDSDYDSFQLGGQQDAALNALLLFVQENQIPLVFVNLPLTKDYLDQIRTQHEQEFQQHMRQVAMEKGLIFRDLSSLWPTKNEYFSDPSHLNQYGAYEVSNQLIQDPIIPWPLVTYSRR